MIRPPERLADGELESRLRAAGVQDPQLHAEFYSNVYGTRNIKDTAEKMGLSHSQWVNISAELLKLGFAVNTGWSQYQSAGSAASVDATTNACKCSASDNPSGFGARSHDTQHSGKQQPHKAGIAGYL